jgi:hypothetical protein
MDTKYITITNVTIFGQNLDIITIIIVAASNTARAVAHYLQ